MYAHLEYYGRLGNNYMFYHRLIYIKLQSYIRILNPSLAEDL